MALGTGTTLGTAIVKVRIMPTLSTNTDNRWITNKGRAEGRVETPSSVETSWDKPLQAPPQSNDNFTSRSGWSFIHMTACLFVK